MSPNGGVQGFAALRNQWRAPLAAMLVLVMWACSDTSVPTASDRATKSVAAASPAGGPETFTGRYVVRHGDDFENGSGTFEPMLEVDDTTILALDFGTGHKPDLEPGKRLRVRGARHEDKIDVEEGSVDTDPPEPFAPFSAANAVFSRAAASRTLSTTTTVSLNPASKRVAIVLFNFSNNASQPYTPAYASGIAFTNSNSVANYYQNNSWGSISLAGDVYGWLTIPDSATSACNYSAWATSANKVAAAAGIDLSSTSYDHVVYAFPSVSGCGWSGLSYMPGRQAWLNGSGGMSLRTMAHELGHNFGTAHANTLNCTEGGVRVSLSANMANCTPVEYGDPFSIMGTGTHRQTNWSLANFGWLPSPNRLDVTTSGDYHLDPLYSPSGIEALRIPRSSSSYFMLEFRQAGPYDAFSSTDPAVNGVTIRLTPGSNSGSSLLDMTPSTSGFGDAPLAVGKSFVDPVTGVSMTTLSASSAGADVRVSFVPDQTAPSAPGSLSATLLDPYQIALSWTASTDNIGVAGYRISRNSAVVGTVTGTSYTDAGLSASTAYDYQVVAFDAAGNVSEAASAGATTPALDVDPPTAPTGLVGSLAKGGKVTLSWKSSTDNLGVAGYRLYKNGKLQATTTATGYTDSLGGGKHPSASYYVVAFDAAGNVSAQSNTILVTQ